MNATAFVYKITNLFDGKSYIGVSKNPVKRFHSHAFHNTKTRSLIKAAIRKHGVDNFKLDILLQSTQQYCYMMERVLVEGYKTQKPGGYNICSGGVGAIGLTGEFNGMFGRTGPSHQHYGKPGYNAGNKHTPEARAKMSKARLGKKKSPEHCAKMKAIALTRSPELLQKMADARRAAFARKKANKP